MTLPHPAREPRERIGVLHRRIELELALLVIAFVLFLKLTPKVRDLTESFELKTIDLRFALRGPREVPPDVTIVAIDDYSLSQYGQWPWPRRYHGQLVERLMQLGAKAIVFDILFMEPSRDGAADDLYFANAMQKAGNVILPIFNITEISASSAYTAPDQVLQQCRYPLSLRGKFRHIYEGIATPLPVLSQAAQGFGTVSLAPDVDGQYRHIALIVGEQGNDKIAYPHVALEVCRYVNGLDKRDVALGPGQCIRLGPYTRIPVTGAQLATLHYYGPFKIQGTIQYRIPTVSYADMFDDIKAPASLFRNRIVIIGWTATGWVDVRPSPLDPIRPGVEVIATLINNILNHHFPIETGEWVNLLLIVLLGTIMAFFIIRLSPARGGMFAGSFLLAYLFIANYLFSAQSVIVEVVPPALVIFLSYVTITAFRLATEEKEKKRIKDTFGAYVTSQVVDELLKSPDKVSLGGTRKEVTVLFADVRGFTTMSEKMAPERVVDYLNDLFEPMNDIIFRYEGTIDNIIGDCLMAMWNAPIDQPNHAERAVRAGLEMLAEMKRLQQLWHSQGRPMLSMGIGINTGEVVVGNVGSSSRKQYTVIGDDVNLAARLESLTRQYNVDMIIGEGTYRILQHKLGVRHLGQVTVKGKTKPVDIYEVLTIDGSGGVEAG